MSGSDSTEARRPRFAFFVTAHVAHADIIGVASVIDGDTIQIHGERIWLFAIDAPESAQLCQDTAGKDYRCRQKVARVLADKIGRQTVRCLGAWLVREGPGP
jgi:endonuclease YncB( thermonuclease family)